jgi:hypothetical protein
MLPVFVFVFPVFSVFSYSSKLSKLDIEKNKIFLEYIEIKMERIPRRVTLGMGQTYNTPPQVVSVPRATPQTNKK